MVLKEIEIVKEEDYGVCTILHGDTPESLEIDGSDVDGLPDEYTLAAGSLLITPDKDYIAFEDGVFTEKQSSGGGGGGDAPFYNPKITLSAEVGTAIYTIYAFDKDGRDSGMIINNGTIQYEEGINVSADTPVTFSDCWVVNGNSIIVIYSNAASLSDYTITGDAEAVEVDGAYGVSITGDCSITVAGSDK